MSSEINVQLNIPLSNTGTENLFGIAAELTSDSELVTINSGEVQYGALNTGES